MTFIDNQFPEILSAELVRPHPNYLSQIAIAPKLVWDATKQPGDTVQLDRYGYWEDSTLTKESRRRSDSQTIGTGGRDIAKEVVYIHLQEFTGPSDPDNPNGPAAFKIPMRKVLFGQRVLYGMSPLAPNMDRVHAFHNSVGSLTLLDDYRRWRDRVVINESLKTSYTYNPGGLADGASYPSNTSVAVSRNTDGKIKVSDVMRIVENLTTRNAPRFPDGTFHALCDQRFMRHLREDAQFREVMRYPGMNQYILGGPGLGQMHSMANPDGSMGPGNMPTGIIFEGVTFWESNNMPRQTVSIGFHNQAADNTTAYLAVFCGADAVGEAMGGEGPKVLLNQNDDFSRFIIAIWQMYCGWELLNENFVQVARSYAD
jgi:hypothetical protein